MMGAQVYTHQTWCLEGRGVELGGRGGGVCIGVAAQARSEDMTALHTADGVWQRFASRSLQFSDACLSSPLVAAV